MYFLIKIILFYTKNLFIRPKNCVQIISYNEKCKKFCKNQFFCNIFTFLSVIRQNFEYNLRILANFREFSRKNSKIYGFRPYVFKKLQGFFFFVLFNKDYTFYTKNLFIRPKNCVQSFLYNERWKKFGKNQFFSDIFTFLSVIRHNFEYNLRILANFGKFSNFHVKTQINFILFTLKIYSLGPKIAFKALCTTKDAKSFVKINFLVTFLHFKCNTHKFWEQPKNFSQFWEIFT